MGEAEGADLRDAFPKSITPQLLHGPLLPARQNVGADLDRLVNLLPAGAAREFVHGLPRRLGREELLASLEALVRLIENERAAH